MPFLGYCRQRGALATLAVSAEEELSHDVFRQVIILSLLLSSFVQAVAAAQAGASVIQPNIGRLGDWYRSNPGVIRDVKVWAQEFLEDALLWSRLVMRDAT